MKCTICKEDKDETEFNWKNKSDGIRSRNCRSCQKVMKDRHYRENKDQYLERNKKHKERYKLWFTELKSNMSCEECGESHPATLDFHHTNPKEKDFNIAHAVAKNSFSCEKVLNEIKKCKVLCSNCHRKLHWNEKHAAVL